MKPLKRLPSLKKVSPRPLSNISPKLGETSMKSLPGLSQSSTAG
jgi:hypothetical protein